MTIKDRTALAKGLVLGLSFLAVLALMFSPLFGNGRNGLEYADDMFNRLAKGSSYFIPKVQKDAALFSGREISLSVSLPKPDDLRVASLLLTRAGLQAGDEQGMLVISGDFGKLLTAALADAESAFRNRNSLFFAQYNLNAQTVLPVWWNVLKAADKVFAREKKFEESAIAVAVMKKAIEPAFNFFDIEAQQVSDRAGIMTGLLAFYVVYTIWWGFAVYYLFEAVGLAMRKGKKKEEE